MAAGGLYTLGGSFWEFGEPDWEHARYLMLWGVAEDHDSNPIKLGLGQLKGRGAKIVAVNPVRSGYGAIADEWIGIRPGTDGLFAFALIHELLRADRIDLDYLVRYTNAHWLVLHAPGTADDGLFARDAEGKALCWDRNTGAAADADSMRCRARRGRRRTCSPMAVARGRPSTWWPNATSIRNTRPTRSATAAAFRPTRSAGSRANWRRPRSTSSSRCPSNGPTRHGRTHPRMVGRPVAMHAMRGISAHSNGFHTCRALHLLQLLLGAVDTPGSFRYQPPFPRPIPPGNRPGSKRDAEGRLDAAPLGFIHGPEDLLVDDAGRPRRLDHAFSWEYPLAVHGMLHTVIRNAWAGDPQPVDVLFLFMANMSWNSAMNTRETMHWLTDKRDDGEYRIPRIIYSDAYSSEMVAYADLVLPDTTYLERFDAVSMLDRPISDADCAADAIRHPVLAPDAAGEGRDVRGFQSVLLDLGARIGLPALVGPDGGPRYRDYADYIVNHERAPGVGLLAGWRGVDGTQEGKGAPNPDQLQRYIANGGFWRAEVPHSGRYYKMANRDYLQWSAAMGFVPNANPVVLQLYSETLQKFRLAAQGHGPRQPPERDRERIATYFDPLPIWYEPFEGAQTTVADFPLSAVTQRPPFMYHAWGSQNAWLRQIVTRNFLYLHPDTAAKHGLVDDDWVHLDSHHGRITVPVRLAGNVQPDTVWTWNAIGKRRGAWKLAANAPEATQGFLLNHLISDITPRGDYANADPVTGQAAWFDLRVRLEKVSAQETSQPQFAILAGEPADNAPLRYGANFRNQR